MTEQEFDEKFDVLWAQLAATVAAGIVIVRPDMGDREIAEDACGIVHEILQIIDDSYTTEPVNA